MRSTAYMHAPFFQNAWEQTPTETIKKSKIVLGNVGKKLLLGSLVLAGICVLVQLWGSWECVNDTCIQKEIDSLRTEKDAYQGKINELNTNINNLKKGFSAGYVIEQIQTQHLQNVHPDILSYAELIPATTAGVSPPTPAEQGRLTAYLASKGAPYANEDILNHCVQAQVSRMQCYMLVAISGAESSFGTQFRKKDSSGAIVVANSEGQQKFNPVGLKGGGMTYPTPDGFYIRPFQSWEDFWHQYPQIMKQGYFSRGGNTLASISKCYVAGDCVSIKSSWVNRSEQFLREILVAMAPENTA